MSLLFACFQSSPQLTSEHKGYVRRERDYFFPTDKIPISCYHLAAAIHWNPIQAAEVVLTALNPKVGSPSSPSGNNHR
jgi:hypothetical protein